MKKLLLLFALFISLAAQAQKVEKETFVYAVKGADTLRLDRYVAPFVESRMRPCMLFVFGGGFVSGTRDGEAYLPFFDYYALRGYVVVSIDYRLGMRAPMEAGTLDERTFAPTFLGALGMAVEDLYDATAFVCAHTADWSVDPRMIVACGSSAGAITVLMGEYGISNGNALTRRLPEGFDYAGVVSFAGAIFDPDSELEWPRTPAPTMLFHGDADPNVPYGAVRYEGAGFFGSQYIARQFTEKRIPHWFYSAGGADHSISMRPMYENRYEIDSFLEKLVWQRQPLVIDTTVTPADAQGTPRTFTMKEYIEANFSR